MSLRDCRDTELCDHPGLVLHRLLDVSDETRRNEFWPWFVERVNAHCGAAATQALLTQLHQRQERVLPALGPARCVIRADVDWRLAAGLSAGRLGVNYGFSLDPLYGVPFLAASAIKGAVTHSGDPDEEMFGSEGNRGGVVFLDAYPEPGAQRYVRLDVINMHHHDYYTGKKRENSETPPAEYFDPKLVHFMTVARNVRFRFRLAGELEEVLTRAAERLRNCLELYGVGAKTRKGYGFFQVVAE